MGTTGTNPVTVLRQDLRSNQEQERSEVTDAAPEGGLGVRVRGVGLSLYVHAMKTCTRFAKGYGPSVYFGKLTVQIRKNTENNRRVVRIESDEIHSRDV